MLNASFQEQTKRTNKKKAIERKKQFRRAQKFVSRQVISIYKSLPFLPRRVFGWLVTEGASDKIDEKLEGPSGSSTNSRRGPTRKSIRFPRVPSKYLPSLILGKSQFRLGAEFRPDLTTSRETQRVNYIFHVQIFSSGYNPVCEHNEVIKITDTKSLIFFVKKETSKL